MTMLQKIGAIAGVLALAGGLVAGWVHEIKKSAAERALWEQRLAALGAEKAALDSLLAQAWQRDSARADSIAALQETVEGAEQTIGALRFARAQLVQERDRLLTEINEEELPAPVRQLLAIERAVADSAAAEAEACGIGLDAAKEQSALCAARVAARDSAIVRVLAQRDSAIALARDAPAAQRSSFLSRLPGELLRGLVWGTAGFAACAIGGGS